MKLFSWWVLIQIGKQREMIEVISTYQEIKITLIEKVLEINPNAIIVLNTGSPVNMPWVIKLNQFYNLGMQAKNMAMLFLKY